ncbi:MAG: FMN-binding negative transcriptional regulator [Alphaproteobacteria bacterium]|nr:FMN-binding negative transcriptional regulator [Alphaproteobacteria bacterium]
MYRPGAFAVDEVQALHEAIRARVLATLAVADGDGVQFAYAPVVVDAVGVFGALRFHLARSNPVADILDGAKVKVSFLGPDGYVSPDWYVGAGFVPTWNYVAIEGEGIATRLTGDACEVALADLSAQEEARLAPKPAWTLDKLTPAKLTQLLAAIAVFTLPLSRLEGKFKLSQDKSQSDRARVMAALARRPDPRSQSLVQAMKTVPSR